MVGLVLVCVVGNAISFYTWKKIGSHRNFSSSIILLMVLAVSDTIVNGVTLVVANVSQLMDLYNGGGYNYYQNVMYPYLAKYAWTFGGVALFVTTWITTLLTIHRYVVLQFPFSDKTKKLTSFGSTMAQVVCIVVLGVAYYTPQFFYYDIVTGKDEENRTSVELHFTALVYNRAFITYSAVSFLVLMVLVPMIISSILTYKIIQLLMKAKAARANMVSRGTRGKKPTLKEKCNIFVNIVHMSSILKYNIQFCYSSWWGPSYLWSLYQFSYNYPKYKKWKVGLLPHPWGKWPTNMRQKAHLWAYLNSGHPDLCLHTHHSSFS